MSKYGLQGFDGADTPLALGSVAGVRWWNLSAPSVAFFRQDEMPALCGVQGTWRMGENIARCGRTGHLVPDEDCGCGFWAYWTLEAAANPHGFLLPVLGVIEGYGRTMLGERGFRCAKARIVALHFPEGTRSLARKAARPPAAWELSSAPDFLKARGEDAVRTWHKMTGRPMPSAVPPAPEPAEEDNVLLSRLVTLELDLEERYGVPVYATSSLMLARHPLTRDYLPR